MRNHGQVSELHLIKLFNFKIGQIKLDGIMNSDGLIGETKGPPVVGNQVRDLIGTDGFLHDSADLEVLFVLINIDINELESALDVMHHSEGIVAFGDLNHVHQANWVLGVSSDLMVDSDQAFLLFEDLETFSPIKGQSQFVSQDELQR